MRHTRHMCDFCGTTMPVKEKHATLSVPLTQDEKALKDRVDGKTSDDTLGYTTVSFTLFGSSVSDSDHASYDMCRQCLAGLLRARLSTITSLRKAMEIE